METWSSVMYVNIYNNPIVTRVITPPKTPHTWVTYVSRKLAERFRVLITLYQGSFLASDSQTRSSGFRRLNYMASIF